MNAVKKYICYFSHNRDVLLEQQQIFESFSQRNWIWPWELAAALTTRKVFFFFTSNAKVWEPDQILEINASFGTELLEGERQPFIIVLIVWKNERCEIPVDKLHEPDVWKRL